MPPIKVSAYGIYINPQGSVLLINDANSGLWGFPGGGVQQGETHEQAVHREFLEETGLRIQGEVICIAEQHDSAKQRYFYSVAAVSGTLNINGNGFDVHTAAFYKTGGLPFPDIALGVEDIAAKAVSSFRA